MPVDFYKVDLLVLINRKELHGNIVTSQLTQKWG